MHLSFSRLFLVVSALTIGSRGVPLHLSVVLDVVLEDGLVAREHLIEEISALFVLILNGSSIHKSVLE